jgi:hypothetical protein
MRIENFCQTCASSLQSQANVKGFNFAIFLPLVLEILVKTLGNCGKDEDDVVSAIEDGGFWTEYHILSAIKEASKLEKIRLPISLREMSGVVLGEAQKAGSVEIKAMLQEANENDPDFDSVYA